MKLLLGLNIFAKLIDVITTYYIIAWVGSTSGEGNPLVKYTMDALGVVPALCISFVIHMACVLTIYSLSCNPQYIKQKFARIGLYIVTTLIILVALNNSIVLYWYVL